MSHSVVWYGDGYRLPNCSFKNCGNQASFYLSGMRIHDSCDCGPVPNSEGEDYELVRGEARACLETEEVSILLCSGCLAFFRLSDSEEPS